MQNVLIVGAGSDGSKILDLLQKNEFMNVLAIIDTDDTAPGIVRAKRLGIAYGDAWSSYVSPMLHIIIDATGDPLVLDALQRSKPAQTLLISGPTVVLFSNLLQWNELEKHSLKKELNDARSMIRTLKPAYTFDDVYGNSEEIKISIEQAMLAARNDVHVLLRGEVGSGKELFAHAIHCQSKRKAHPFIRVNCAALDHRTMETDFFGADGREKGLFGESEKGTLFLDEIADLTLSVQKKLLHYLQAGTITSTDEEVSVYSNNRVITATSQNLEKAMHDGFFLEELYYVLQRMVIQIPPLRLRRADIPAIAAQLLGKLNAELSMNVRELSSEANERLKQYEWPGNIRELENVLQRAMIYMDKRNKILNRTDVAQFLTLQDDAHPEQKGTLASMMDDYEKTILIAALQKSNGNKSLAANKLEISLRSLYYKLEKFDLV